jgi:hypothetical protein
MPKEVIMPKENATSSEGERDFGPMKAPRATRWWAVRNERSASSHDEVMYVCLWAWRASVSTSHSMHR